MSWFVCAVVVQAHSSSEPSNKVDPSYFTVDRKTTQAEPETQAKYVTFHNWKREAAVTRFPLQVFAWMF